MSGNCHLFVGPSGYGVLDGLQLPPEVRVLPPAARGDIVNLLGEIAEGDCIALADGIFGGVSAVGHKELLQAIDAGVQVWGLCSMGAIRACELDRYGMTGFGEVYRRFADDPLFADDEVALLHLPMAPFESITEPLVHLRALVRGLEKQGAIETSAGEKVIATLKSRWFGERTLPATLALLLDCGANEGLAKQAVGNVAAFRSKQADLKRFIERTPWRST